MKTDGEQPSESGRDPGFQLTLTRAMLETLELERILYVILSGITAGDGLDFNRAFLFLADEGFRALQGRLAIGPETGEEAHRIWEEMEHKRFNLELLMERYEAFRVDERASALTRRIAKVAFTLPLSPKADGLFLSSMEEVMREKRPKVINEGTCTLGPTHITLEKVAFVPLTVADAAIGVLVCDNAYNKHPIGEVKKEEALSLANLTAIAVERARLHEKIRRMADLDGLTHLVNRRRFDEILKRHFEDARAHGQNLALMFVDLDLFKEINDTHGHLAGDDVLRGVAAIIRDRLRSGDVAARYGGDEMVVILPRADATQAAEVGLELKKLIANARFGGEEKIECTVSVGIASLKEGHKSPQDLIAEADVALYKAKSQGRNGVVTLSAEPPALAT